MPWTLRSGSGCTTKHGVWTAQEHLGSGQGNSGIAIRKRRSGEATQDPVGKLRGGGMVAVKVAVALLVAAVVAVCIWGMTTTDPGIVRGASTVVDHVKVRPFPALPLLFPILGLRVARPRLCSVPALRLTRRY